MDLVKVTSNGTVSMPINSRKKFNTDYYQVFEEIDRVIFLPVFLPKKAPSNKFKKRRWTMQDLDNIVYKAGKDKNLSKNIDNILADESMDYEYSNTDL